MEKNELPKLDPSNAGPWVLAIRSAAYAHKSFDHICGTPTPPTEPEALATFQQKKYIRLGNILASVPLHILNLLVTSSDDHSPFDLLNDIKNHVDTDNALDHKHLKLEAEQFNFELGMTLNSYVKSHTTIRSRMIVAHYPDLKDPTTTIEFLINGLRLNPETASRRSDNYLHLRQPTSKISHTNLIASKLTKPRNSARPYHCTHPSYICRSILTADLFKPRSIAHRDTRTLQNPQNSNRAAITFDE